MHEHDVVISGAGPAGSTCARRLGDAGLRVLLLDQAHFPREKVCGGLLSSKGVLALKELGVWEKVQAKGVQPISSLVFFHGEKELGKIPTHAGNEEAGFYGISRMDLDNILFEHATKTCEFREETYVNGISRIENGMNVHTADLSLKQTKDISCQLVVGADGAHSAIARALDAHAHPALHTQVSARARFSSSTLDPNQMNVFFSEEWGPGYAWISPIGNGTFSAGISAPASWWNRRNHDATLAAKEWWSSPSVQQHVGDVVVFQDFSEWEIPLAGEMHSPVFERALLIGDAARVADPFTGAGMGNALLSAQLASETIIQAHEKQDFSRAGLESYAQKLHAALLPEIQSRDSLHLLFHFRPFFRWMMQRAGKNPMFAKELAKFMVPSASRSAPPSVSGLIKLGLQGLA